jgi:hypothetical protein
MSIEDKESAIINDKLSAIRAINEEKEYAEDRILVLSTWSKNISAVNLNGEADFIIPDNIGNAIKELLLLYYEIRRKELISKAEELIKAKDDGKETPKDQ